MFVLKETEIEGDMIPIFRLERSKIKQAVPFLFNSPHSGSYYPPHFLALSRLEAQVLRKTEDAFVHELFSNMPHYGARFLQSLFPRSYVDLNREPYELDRSMLEGEMPDYANTDTVRVKNGLGTVARLVSEYESIYKARLPVKAVLQRIELLYKPYHAQLSQELDDIHDDWGMSILVDCHSMPSFASIGRINRQPDIVLGDRYGVSCDAQITRLFKDSLVKRGLKVALNKPYAGGFITKNYGQPKLRKHAIQIEINRGIYMNESRMEKNKHFEDVRQVLQESMKDVLQATSNTVFARKFAAE